LSESVIFQGFGHVTLEVFQALMPLAVIFVVLQVFYLKLPRDQVYNILKGLVMAFFGLILFLQGVQIGFLPVGKIVGEVLGEMSNRWILIPIGFILGFVATIAEPAVRILSSEVERASAGYIREKLMLYTLSLGVAVFVAIGMAKIIFGIPLTYIIIPGYLLAIAMLKLSDSTFVSIAFDSGGVATGPMTVTFIMAMAVGVATVMESRNAIVDGFGLIALVALAPILSVLVLGLIYREKEESL